MRTFFESMGTVQVLTVVLLLQLFVLYAIITGRIVRLLRFLILLPLAGLIFFFFFSSPDRLNLRSERADDSRPSLSETQERTDEQTLPKVAEKTDKSTKNDFLFPLEEENLVGDELASSPFRNPLTSEGEGRFASVSSESAASFRSVSSPSAASSAAEPPTPVPLNRAGAAASNIESAVVNDAPAATGGVYSGSARPLQPTLPTYAGSQATVVDPVRSAEYTSTPDDGQNVVQAGFRSGPDFPSLRISPDQIELSPDNSRRLIDYVSRSIREKIEETRPAVVHIEATVTKEGMSGKKRYDETGGGVIVKTGRGDFYVITNNHVAGNAVSNEAVRIVLHDGQTLHPIRILSCPEFDIALLQLAEKNLCAARLGDSDGVKIIDNVLAIGSPFGLEGSVSSGIVSGVERRNIPLGDQRHQMQNFIQTDAPINPGNSGGPLLNVRGEVIGINTAIATNSGGSEGVGLAIPINSVKYIAGRLIRDGVYRRSYMGVELDRKFTPEEKAALGLRKKAFAADSDDPEKLVGARVLSVQSDSPAEAAGLQSGDIILGFNGKIVEDEEHFNHMVGLAAVDEAPLLDILRNNTRTQAKPKLVSAAR